jgi:hypothetical protein
VTPTLILCHYVHLLKECYKLKPHEVSGGNDLYLKKTFFVMGAIIVQYCHLGLLTGEKSYTTD